MLEVSTGSTAIDLDVLDHCEHTLDQLEIDDGTGAASIPPGWLLASQDQIVIVDRPTRAIVGGESRSTPTTEWSSVRCDAFEARSSS